MNSLLDLTKPVQTRDGRPVTLLTTCGRGDYPIVGYIGDDMNISVWMDDGRVCTYMYGLNSPRDLVNPAPSIEEREMAAFKEANSAVKNGTNVYRHFWEAGIKFGRENPTKEDAKP